MKCPKCQHPIDGPGICPGCGAKLSARKPAAAPAPPPEPAPAEPRRRPGSARPARVVAPPARGRGALYGLIALGVFLVVGGGIALYLWQAFGAKKSRAAAVAAAPARPAAPAVPAEPAAKPPESAPIPVPPTPPLPTEKPRTGAAGVQRLQAELRKPAAAPDGPRIEVPEAGFSILVPPGFERKTSSDSGVPLTMVRQAPPCGFLVTVEATPPDVKDGKMDWKAFLAGVRQELESTARDVKMGRIQEEPLGGHPALRFQVTYTKEGMAVGVYQAVVISPKRVYNLNWTTAPDKLATMLPLFEETTRSLRIAP